MDRHGNYYSQGRGLWRSSRDDDFEESEVWDVLRERNGQSVETSFTCLPDEQTDRYASSHLWYSPKMVPQWSSSADSSSNGSTRPLSIFAHQSEPVDIPDSSKEQEHLGRSKSSKVAPSGRLWLHNRDEDNDEDSGEEDNDDDEYGEKLPPHEHIAKRLARSKQTSSYSVFEGVGRKLRGRDLSKLRNDVLTRTGFLE